VSPFPDAGISERLAAPNAAIISIRLRVQVHDEIIGPLAEFTRAAEHPADMQRGADRAVGDRQRTATPPG